MSEGVVDRYDLSFDGRRIVFDYKPPQPEGFRIYEIGVDGAGLRQITFPPEDEDQRIATYCTWSPAELQQDPWRYGHWTDDMHPCYLPDGGIAFTSTRSEQSVLCGGHSLTVTEPASRRSRRLGAAPTVPRCTFRILPDGDERRTDHVQPLGVRGQRGGGGPVAVGHVSRRRPAGGDLRQQHRHAPVFNQAKQVPGRDNLVVCLGAAHAPGNMGAILLVDRHKNKRSDEP